MRPSRSSPGSPLLQPPCRQNQRESDLGSIASAKGGSGRGNSCGGESDIRSAGGSGSVIGMFDGGNSGAGAGLLTCPEAPPPFVRFPGPDTHGSLARMKPATPIYFPACMRIHTRSTERVEDLAMNLRQGGTVSLARLLHIAWFAFLVSQLACAPDDGRPADVTRVRRAPEVLLHDATTVARVAIASSDAIEFELNGESHRCGYFIRSRIVEVLKGDGGEAEFLADEDLRIGEEYFVALKDFGGELSNGIEDPTLPERVAAHLECRIRTSVHAYGAVHLADNGDTLAGFVTDSRIVPRSTTARANVGMAEWSVIRADVLAVLAGSLPANRRGKIE